MSDTYAAVEQFQAEMGERERIKEAGALLTPESIHAAKVCVEGIGWAFRDPKDRSRYLHAVEVFFALADAHEKTAKLLEAAE